MAPFLANETNSTGGDITVQKAHVQIMYRVFEDIFSGM